MNKKCGLVNEENPCRCRNKTKSFIEQGIVNPKSKKWLSNYRSKIHQLTTDNITDIGLAKDEIYGKIYREDPYKTNLKADEVYNEILNHKNFTKLLNL